MSNDAGAALRVLLWSYKGAGLHYGGPGTSAFRLYSKARPGRFVIDLAHGNPAQPQLSLFHRQHLIYPLPSLRPWPQWRFVQNALKWVRQNHGHYDVFHGLQAFHLTVRPALEAQRLGLPAVAKIAAHRADLSDKGGWKRWLALPARRRRMAMQLSGMIAISDDIAKELLEYGFPESKIARIPNGVDTEQFRPADQDERARQRKTLGWRDLPTVAFVGGITPRKNPMVLVEALGLLRQRGIDAQLAIIGPDHAPAYTQAIKQRARQLHVDEVIIWHGFTEDVAPLYRASDVYALPSSNEGMPNALLEAMASGLPSVVTPISGSRDLVQEDVTGRLAPAEAQALAEALAVYLSDPSLASRHGQAARDTIMSRYSAAAVLDAHERLFRRIMAGGPAAE